MELQHWLTIGSVLLTYLVMGISAFVKLNIKNTENAKDILALRQSLQRHEDDNKRDTTLLINTIREIRDDIKQEILYDRTANRKNVETLTTQVSKISLLTARLEALTDKR